MKTSKTPIRCALIGYGPFFGMGLHHGKQINSTPGLEVTAVCDIDPKRLAVAANDFPGIETFTDVDKLLASEVADLCVIILPHNLHGSIGLKCLQAGCHVILEKPMCLTTAEAKAMIDAAEANGVMLTVYHNRRRQADIRRPVLRLGRALS